MGLETGTFISDLNAANPTAGDPKSQGDDHLRLIKSTVKATFPNVTGAVTPTQTELNYVAGATSNLQTQITAKANKTGETYSGTHNFTGASVTVSTQAVATNNTTVASTAFVQSAILNSSGISAQLPAQPGNAGKVLGTNGTSASWVEGSPIAPNPAVLDFEANLVFANGSPQRPVVYNLDADRELLDFQNGHCAVYNRTTKTMGPVASYRSTLPATNGSIAVVVDANTVIIASCVTTAFEAVGITISGVTCTVGTPQTATLAGNFSGFGNFIMVGTTAVLSYGRATTTKALRAMTISGGTVTLGAETTLTGASTLAPISEAHTSSLLLAFHVASATTYASPYTVSGTTLTLGTEATVTLTSGTAAIRLGGKLSTGRYLIGSFSSNLVALASVAGTVASWSAAVSIGITPADGFIHGCVVLAGSYALIGNNGSFVLVQDNAGTPVLLDTFPQSLMTALAPTATGFLLIAQDGRLGTLSVNSLTTPTSITVNAAVASSAFPAGGGQLSPTRFTGSRLGFPAGATSVLVNGSKVMGPVPLSATVGSDTTYYYDGSTLKTVVQPFRRGSDTTTTASSTAYSAGYSAMWFAPVPTSQSTTSFNLQRIALP